ncbi:MAG: hypothetical protein WAQ33_17170 [Gaiellaceae bacterium]
MTFVLLGEFWLEFAEELALPVWSELPGPTPPPGEEPVDVPPPDAGSG